MLIQKCVCGAPAAEAAFVNGQRAAHGIDRWRCSCGVEWLANIGFDPLPTYTSGAYHSSTVRHPNVVPYDKRYESDLVAAEARWHRYQQFFDLESFAHVLDVGCANGAFVDYLSSTHERVLAFGIEPDPRWAREGIGTGTLRDFPVDLTPDKGDLSFDLITYHDVLEHVLDPREEMRLAASYLRPHGLIVVDVPNVFVPEGTKHYKAEHVWYFTPTSLINLAREARFVCIGFDYPIPGKQVFYGRKETP